MTIQEAIRSGKRFRLQESIHWCSVNSYGEILYGNCPFLSFSSELLSDAWEVEPDEQVRLDWKMVEEVLLSHNYHPRPSMEAIKLKLGFTR